MVSLPARTLGHRPFQVLLWAALAVLPPEWARQGFSLDWRAGLAADMAWTPVALYCQLRLLRLLGGSAGLRRPDGPLWRPFLSILGADLLMGLRLAVTAQAGCLPALLLLAWGPARPATFALSAALALAGLVPAVLLLYRWLPVAAFALWRGLGPVQALEASSAAMKGTLRANLGLLAAFAAGDLAFNLPSLFLDDAASLSLPGLASGLGLCLSFLLESSLVVLTFPPE
jgi:hypothetical protein